MPLRCYVYCQGVVGWRLHSSVKAYDKYDEVRGRMMMMMMMMRRRRRKRRMMMMMMMMMMTMMMTTTTSRSQKCGI